MSDQTCCCFSYSTAFNTLGFGQINAALYCLARASLKTPYYWQLDLMIAVIYIMRCVGFLLVLKDDTTDNRKSYYDTQKNTGYLMAVCGTAYAVINYLEWGQRPTQVIFLWAILGWMNWYNTGLLRNFWTNNYILKK